MWAYLFVFHEGFFGDADAIYRLIYSHPYIQNWYRWAPNSYLLVSNMTATTLTEEIQAHFPGRKFVIVDTAGTDRNGRLPKEVWDLMRRPRPAGHP
jgi:hypothetical protein